MTKKYKSETNGCNYDENAMKHEIKQYNFQPILTPPSTPDSTRHFFNFMTSKVNWFK